MDFKDAEDIVEGGKRRPKRMIVVICVLLFFVALSAYVTGFFGEIGKRHAGTSNEGHKILVQPHKEVQHEKNNTYSTETTQQTYGNQSPAINVAPRGTSTIHYGASSDKRNNE
jgi:hypothetical protein